MGLIFSAKSEAFFLIALGIGYIVLYLANREEKSLRTTGFLIGILIIGISGIHLLYSILLNAKICRSPKIMRPSYHQMMLKEQIPQMPHQLPRTVK